MTTWDRCALKACKALNPVKYTDGKKSAGDWLALGNGDDVDSQIKQGEVLLNGAVKCQAEKGATLRGAAYTAGWLDTALEWVESKS